MPRGVLLMYQMGAGKTMPSIAIAARNAHQRHKKVVVICKKSVRDNYIGQFATYVRLYQNAMD
jgi:ATP-dependent 26S proteasome regulatory subunit